MTVALLTCTAVPPETIMLAIWPCISAVAAGEAAGLSKEPWSPAMKRTAPRMPSAAEVVWVIVLSPSAAISGSVPESGAPLTVFGTT